MEGGSQDKTSRQGGCVGDGLAGDAVQKQTWTDLRGFWEVHLQDPLMGWTWKIGRESSKGEKISSDV